MARYLIEYTYSSNISFLFLNSLTLRARFQLHVFWNLCPFTVLLRREILLLLFLTRDGGQVQRVDDSKCDIGPTCITCYQCGVLRFSCILQLRLFSCNNRIMTPSKDSNCFEGALQITQKIKFFFFVAQFFMHFLISPSELQPPRYDNSDHNEST